MYSEKIQKAIALYDEILSATMTEGLFEIMNEILNEIPEAIDVFIDKFNSPSSKDDKEVLGQIILKQVHYLPVINYLKNEMGWDDFTGYAGFPEC